MEVNVVDIVDRWMLTISRQLRSLNQPLIEMEKGPGGVARMVDQVIAKVLRPGALDVLRIYSHGNAGVLGIASGDGQLETDEDSRISLENFPQLSPALERLTQYFARGARVEILACYVATENRGNGHIVAANSRGEQLLKKLASLWRVRVLASNKTGHGPPLVALNFVGPVVEVQPGGGLRSVSPPEITKIERR